MWTLMATLIITEVIPLLVLAVGVDHMFVIWHTRCRDRWGMVWVQKHGSFCVSCLSLPVPSLPVSQLSLLSLHDQTAAAPASIASSTL